MEYVQYVYERVKNSMCTNDANVSLIFCGDFNSVPECGIYKLMTEGCVPDNFVDFQSSKYKKKNSFWISNMSKLETIFFFFVIFSDADEAVQGVTLQQPFKICSAYGPIKYTNFTPLFSACLDYIFYKTNNLNVFQVVPTPSDEELAAHTGLPSVVFPSDHIALIADFKWNL